MSFDLHAIDCFRPFATVPREAGAENELPSFAMTARKPPRDPEQLRADALSIWQAGLDGVRSDTLMAAAMQVDGDWLIIDDEPLDLRNVARIVVVGAGKAGAGMAAAIEAILGPRLLVEKQVTGWLNVPADCVRPLQAIHLHAARPPGRNEPTADGVIGSEAILRLVGEMSPDDLCLCLISGGGSALLPAPMKEITLADKLAVTRHLSAAGANIVELNTVRKQLSRIKGGGLARACRAKSLISLVISDVIGNPLDTIASGPTLIDDRSTNAAAALAILNRYDAANAGISRAVFDYLRAKDSNDNRIGVQRVPDCSVRHVIIGNNAIAVDAAGVMAEQLGYSHAMIAATELEGPVDDIGRHLAQQAVRMRDHAGPNCLISGGEGTVRLADESQRGLGGRNQQLVLAAFDELTRLGDSDGIVLLSAGTDGEDGPTDAAGAVLDSRTFAQTRTLALDPNDFLQRNDAYHFFEPLDGLIKTGPTHTNVCDLRVMVVDQSLGPK